MIFIKTHSSESDDTYLNGDPNTAYHHESKLRILDFVQPKNNDVKICLGQENCGLQQFQLKAILK